MYLFFIGNERYLHTNHFMTDSVEDQPTVGLNSTIDAMLWALGKKTKEEL